MGKMHPVMTYLLISLVFDLTLSHFFYFFKEASLSTIKKQTKTKTKTKTKQNKSFCNDCETHSFKTLK